MVMEYTVLDYKKTRACQETPRADEGSGKNGGGTHNQDKMEEIESRKPCDDFQEYITTEGLDRDWHFVVEGQVGGAHGLGYGRTDCWPL